MSNKKKSILEEAILDAKRIQEALESNSKEILRSLAKEEIDSLVKESLEEDYMEEDYMEEDVDVTAEEPMEGPMVDIGMDMGMSDEVEVDMTSASDDEVISVYKKLTDNDEIEVVVDDEEIYLSVDEPGEFLIKMDSEDKMDMDLDMGMEEPEMVEPVDMEMDIETDDDVELDDLEDADDEVDMDDEDMEMDDEDMEMDDEDIEMDDEDDEEMDDEDDEEIEEMVYEIEMAEEYMEEMVDEDDEVEKGEGMKDLDEYISTNAVKQRGAGGDLTDIKGPGAKQAAKFYKNESKLKSEYKNLLKESNELKTKNIEYKGALKKFRGMLAETVVFNSNLTYVTKLFMEHSTTKKEKENIFKRFDEEVSTLKESKRLYKMIQNELGSRKPLNESIDNKINKEVKTGISKQLNESTAYIDRETSRIIGLMKRVDKR